MQDRDENLISTAVVVDQTLDATKADWQHYGKLAADAGTLKTKLGAVTTATKNRKAVEDAGGELEERDLAEIRALDAVMVIVAGAASSVIDAPNATLAGIGAKTRTELDELRDTEQVAQLEAIYEQAHPLRAELVDDLVTDAHFEELQKATAALKPFVGKGRSKMVTLSALIKAERKAVAEVRTVLKRLDKRMTVVEQQNKALADRYFQARMIVDAKGPSAKKDEGAGA